MPVLQAPRAWLPQGWAGDVRIEIDDQGWITEVAPGTPDRGAQTMVGAVVPGMANLHSHAFQRAMAGLTERAAGPSEDFWSWRGTMHRFAAALVPDQVEAIAAQLYVEMVKAGYTGVAEFHYLHHGPGGRRYDALADHRLPLFLAVRVAELEADDRYDPAVQGVYIESFGRDGLSPDEVGVLPVVIAVESLERLAGADMANVARLLLSGRPVRVVLACEPASSFAPGSSRRTAAWATAADAHAPTTARRRATRSQSTE